MSLPLPHPDPTAVREALRVLRHGLRRSRKVLREAVPVEALPEPAAQLAKGVLGGLDRIAGNVDQATTEVARRLLFDERHPVPALQDLGSGPEADVVFAEALYSALRSVLRRLGDPDSFVSEAIARRARIGSETASPGLWADRPGEAAADMVLRLLAAQVVRGLSPELEADLGKDAAAPVAVFAALLWILSDRPEEDAEEALDASVDLSVALAPEIAAAAAARDRDRLTALFEQFASHV